MKKVTLIFFSRAISRAVLPATEGDSVRDVTGNLPLFDFSPDK